MAKQRPGFMIYEDMRSAIELLNDKDAGMMLKACIRYVFDGEEPEFYGIDDYVWKTNFKEKMDRDQLKYERVSEVRKEAINKRWHPESARKPEDANDTNVSGCIQSDTNDTNVSFVIQSIPTNNLQQTTDINTTNNRQLTANIFTAGQQTSGFPISGESFIKEEGQQVLTGANTCQPITITNPISNSKSKTISISNPMSISNSIAASVTSTDPVPTSSPSTLPPPVTRETFMKKEEEKMSWDIRKPFETDDEFILRRKREMIAHFMDLDENGEIIDEPSLRVV